MRRLVLAAALLAGCSGHPNPDTDAAHTERRASELRAAVGRRASVIPLPDEGPPLVVYDVHDLLCVDLPAPEISLSMTPAGGDGSDLTFDDEEDDGDHPGTCIDSDKLVELVEGKLGLEGEDAGCSVAHAAGLLVVRGPWWVQHKVGALVLAIAAGPRHVARGGSNPVRR